MPADSEKERLPFEPKSKRKKAQGEVPAAADRAVESVGAGLGKANRQPAKYTRDETSIPEIVSRRMLRRMLYFSGVPVVFGVLIFFASYVLIVQEIAELPNVVVLLTTLACFGLSVVGLSYGALSASWEEEALGSMLGVEQFRVNLGRLLGSWREAREARRDPSS